MKRLSNKTLLLAIFLNSVLIVKAQTNGLEYVKSEIMKLTDIEINAFRAGDCKTMGDLIDDNATFYLDGKKAPSKEMIIGFCNRVQRPFEKPSKVTSDFFPTSNNSAYVVRIMEFTKDGKLYKKEIVTKVWVKGKEGWKISHLHSTIKVL